MNIDIETKKLNELSNEYESAKLSYLVDIEHDRHRTDGSARQDALHECLMKKSRDNYETAKAAFEAQVKVVAKLLDS
ncbi:hypothetical protein NMS72_003691, partial [Vibrio cholerae]|nr:hypothetical protein [Vibrio cholerae]